MGFSEEMPSPVDGWLQVVEAYPEELALAAVSVNMSALLHALQSWAVAHKKKVERGELPPEGLVLDVDYGQLAETMNLLAQLAAA